MFGEGSLKICGVLRTFEAMIMAFGRTTLNRTCWSCSQRN